MASSKIYRFYRQKIFPKVNHLRGTTFLKDLLEDFALRNIEKVSEKDVKDIFTEDWDNLIVIDACRQDLWEEETGMTGSRISKASTTSEYVEKNFSKGTYEDYIYISANPHFSDQKFKELTGRNPEDVFHTIFKTFNTKWDEKNGTVLPADTISDALTAQKLFPDKKLIIHFLPSHYPFIRKPISEGISPNLDKDYRNCSPWKLAEKKQLDHESVEEGYRDNMNYVYEHLKDLEKELEGKTILTSDHGNLIGEAGFYGHPANRNEKGLRKVPFVER